MLEDITVTGVERVWLDPNSPPVWRIKLSQDEHYNRHMFVIKRTIVIPEDMLLLIMRRLLPILKEDEN